MIHIIILQFGNNKASAKEFMAAHNEWINKGMSEGIFQCVGSLNGGGGCIIAHGETIEEIERRVRLDPFVREGIVTAEIHSADVNRAVPDMNYLITAE